MLKYIFAIVFMLTSFFEPLHGFIKAPNRRIKINSTLLHRDKEKILTDLTSYQDYQDIYREMMKISRESMESGDEDRSRRVIGQDDSWIYQGDETRHRGRSDAGRSAMGRRRARSQALRREKLNSQSLRSHMMHTRQAADYTRAMFETN